MQQGPDRFVTIALVCCVLYNLLRFIIPNADIPVDHENSDTHDDDAKEKTVSSEEFGYRRDALKAAEPFYALKIFAEIRTVHRSVSVASVLYS